MFIPQTHSPDVPERPLDLVELELEPALGRLGTRTHAPKESPGPQLRPATWTVSLQEKRHSPELQSRRGRILAPLGAGLRYKPYSAGAPSLPPPLKHGLDLVHSDDDEEDESASSDEDSFASHAPYGYGRRRLDTSHKHILQSARAPPLSDSCSGTPPSSILFTPFPTPNRPLPLGTSGSKYTSRQYNTGEYCYGPHIQARRALEDALPSQRPLGVDGVDYPHTQRHSHGQNNRRNHTQRRSPSPSSPDSMAPNTSPYPTFRPNRLPTSRANKDSHKYEYAPEDWHQDHAGLRQHRLRYNNSSTPRTVTDFARSNNRHRGAHETYDTMRTSSSADDHELENGDRSFPSLSLGKPSSSTTHPSPPSRPASAPFHPILLTHPWLRIDSKCIPMPPHSPSEVPDTDEAHNLTLDWSNYYEEAGFGSKESIKYRCKIDLKEKGYMRCGYTGCKQTVVRHIKSVHFFLKPHKCDYSTLEGTPCGKRFPQKASLEIHENSVHTKEKPYKCKYCTACFSDPARRNKHFQKDHPDKEQELQKRRPKSTPIRRRQEIGTPSTTDGSQFSQSPEPTHPIRQSDEERNVLIRAHRGPKY